MQYIDSLKQLVQFPSENIWMLAVDGKLYDEEKGPLGFEQREKGSVQAILKGLITSLEKLGEKLSVEQIKMIHKSCMDGVPSRNPCIPGEFRTNAVLFDVSASFCTPKGLDHLLRNKLPTANLIPSEFAVVNSQCLPLASIKDKTNLRLAANPKDALVAEETSQQMLQELTIKLTQENTKLIYQPPMPIDFGNLLATYINSYNNKINRVNTEDEKILIIAELVQQCTRLHPFRDGNNRTFVNCLLNRLLVENNLCPALFFEPNVFEFHSPEELVTVIKAAQNQFMAIINAPNSPVFNYDNSNTGALDDSKFLTMGKEFKKQLSPIANKIARQHFQNNNYLLASEYYSIGYELEKQFNGESTNTAISLFSLALSLKKLGELHTAKAHFSNTLSLFATHKRQDLLAKANKHISEIDGLLSSNEEKEVVLALCENYFKIS